MKVFSSLSRYCFWLPGRFLGPLIIAVTLLACSSGNDPTKSVPMKVSFKTLRSTTASKTLDLRLTDANGNALEITSAELVLRKMELERTEADCDSAKHDDDSEEIEKGPFLVHLPIDASALVVVLETLIPVGTWEEVEFDVHKLTREDPSDAAFLDATGFSEGTSVRVTGTWTPAGGSPTEFTFTSDLNAEQEIEFHPPLVVRKDEVKNVTFIVNLNGWFRDANGMLVDPRSANQGSINESMVEHNIKTSIEGFEDDDQDGVKD